MNQNNILNGLLLGAGLMYLLDPDKGRRRRAVIRDQFIRSTHKMEDAANAATRDLKNRAYGVVAEARTRVTGEGPVDDPVLEARVRAALGRAVSHPGAITVTANDGVVTLIGPVLADEAEALVSTVESVRGVHAVLDRLERHRSAENVPGLQGQGEAGARFELMQENWSPAARLLVGLAGGVLTGRALRQGGTTGTLLGSVGLGLLARAVTNLTAGQLTGMDVDRRAVDIRKSINIDVPVEEAFEFWSRFENFPRFMSHLEQVSRVSEDLSHWVAKGPGNLPIEWDAEITQWTPNEVIAWRSVSGSPVGNAGLIRFLRNEKGGTRIDIRMTYNPPAGAIGHAVASFFGTDPKRAMDEDLVRLKSLLELGKTSSEGHTTTRESAELPR